MQAKIRKCAAETEDQLHLAVEAVLEALECLLYLMGKEAAGPDHVEVYVAEATKILSVWDIQLHQQVLRRRYLMM